MNVAVLSHHKHFTAVEVLAQFLLHELSDSHLLDDATFTDMWSFKNAGNPDFHRRLVFQHRSKDLTAIDFERMRKEDSWLPTLATLRFNSKYWIARRSHSPFPHWTPLNEASKPDINSQYFLPSSDLSDDDPSTEPTAP